MLEVRKETPDPRLQVVLEDRAVGSTGSHDLATGETGHDFEKYCGVILGFGRCLRPLNTNLLQGFAETGERPPMKVTRQIIGRVGEELATPEADEEIEIFALDPFGIRARGCRTKCGMRNAQRRCITA